MASSTQRRLSLLDSTFLRIETAETPMHVGALQTQCAESLEAFYPVSLAFQGLGMNITCVSYGGRLNIGVVGGRDGVPHLQRVAVYIADALDELDAAVSSRGLTLVPRSADAVEGVVC